MPWPLHWDGSRGSPGSRPVLLELLGASPGLRVASHTSASFNGCNRTPCPSGHGVICSYRTLPICSSESESSLPRESKCLNINALRIFLPAKTPEANHISYYKPSIYVRRHIYYPPPNALPNTCYGFWVIEQPSTTAMLQRFSALQRVPACNMAWIPALETISRAMLQRFSALRCVMACNMAGTYTSGSVTTRM